MSVWLNASLEVLDVHGGTSEEDIAAAVSRAEEKANSSSGTSFLFLDEMNACPHTALMEEVIVKKTLNNRPIDPRVLVLAAANPYRIRKGRAEGSSGGKSGFVYSGSKSAFKDEDLVYNVHAIPTSLHEYVFDFGALSPKQEKKYVQAMVASSFPLASRQQLLATVAVVAAAQA